MNFQEGDELSEKRFEFTQITHLNSTSAFYQLCDIEQIIYFLKNKCIISILQS